MRITYIIIVLISLSFISCEKIVAEDITGKTPILILPAINDTIESNPVQFKWEPLEGASKYRLEVVKTSFSSIQEYVLDSIITGTTFSMNLDSSEYQVQLRALNGGYESIIATPRTFWVGVSSSGSSNTSTTLSYPDDLAYLNTSPITFQWLQTSGATSYEFSLRMGSSFETGSILETQNGISTLQYNNSNVLAEGHYFWGVKSYGTTNPIFSVREFYIDITSPNDPILTMPLNNATASAGNIDFSWDNGVDGGTIQSPITSTIEIADNASFSGAQITNVVGSSISVSLITGTYYWRVINTDGAGNTSAYSSTNMLTVF